MRLLCPECYQPLDPQLLVCRNAHQYSIRDGVLILLAKNFAEELLTFSATLNQMRADNDKRLTDPAIYNGLPCASSLQANFEWRDRCQDLQLVKQAVGEYYGPKTLTILDVGAYNGWLSHNLANLGHEVTGIDYFRDPYDGLGAGQFHSAIWQPIQMDLLDLTVLDQVYDVVIMNHGLHFFPDPLAYLQKLLNKTAPGGLFMTIGLQFWRKPYRRQQRLEARNQVFFQKYGREMLLRPAPGYFDENDRGKMMQLGLKIYPYRHYQLNNLLSHAISTRPWQGFAVAQKPV